MKTTRVTIPEVELAVLLLGGASLNNGIKTWSRNDTHIYLAKCALKYDLELIISFFGVFLDWNSIGKELVVRSSAEVR